jgi:paraquat-inducible protein B
VVDRGDFPDAIPDAVVAPKRRRPQLVWALPIVAALIGGWLAVKAIIEQGPTVRITFQTAEGLEAGKTKIRYKDVEIGLISDVELADDRSHVIATAQFTNHAKSLLVDDTRFWVVKPRVSSSSVSGLGTLFSGSYIGVDIGQSKKSRRDFVGLETPPIVTADRPGARYVLRSEQIGSLGVGSPLFYRHISVGQVIAYDLDPGGNTVTLRVFVNAPYDQYVTKNTRFWHASGVDVTVDATGVSVNTESLASILAGGIAFQAPPDKPPEPVAEPETVFELATSRVAAMKEPDTEVVTFVLYFEDTTRGLSAGAPVDFRGVELGEVKSVNLEYDAAKMMFRFPVEINLYPERLRAHYRAGATQANTNSTTHELLKGLIERGFRAQLKTGNLLTGQLYVALDLFPQAKKATMDWTQTPLELPTISGSLGQLQEILFAFAQKLDKVPVDKIGIELAGTLSNARQLLAHIDKDVAPAAQDLLNQANHTLDAAQRSVLREDAPLQQDMSETLQELTRAATALRELANYLERHPEALLRGKPKEESHAK